MAEGRWDFVLLGGTIIDGTGRPRFEGDVALEGEHIAALGTLERERALHCLEVSGLVVCPGFVDIHSHSDLSLFVNPFAESKLLQGVTTEVVGNCGASAAPVPKEKRELMRGRLGFIAAEVDWRWESFGEYRQALGEAGLAVNVAPLVGHSTLRSVVVGEQRSPAGARELSEMRRLLSQALEEGAFGLSSGLTYVPGCFADTEELVELARVLPEAGGFYASHIRGEGQSLLSAVEEAIEIGRRSGAAVQISHLKADGRENWGKTEECLTRIEGAGERVTYDAYPYTAWSTSLAQMLPEWARAGSSEEMRARLSDLDARTKLRAELERGPEERWRERLIASVSRESNRWMQGLTLQQIAEKLERPPAVALLDLLAEEGQQATMVGFGMCERDVERVLAHPRGMIGSDAQASAPTGSLGRARPHPRAYGTFPRVLGHYVRERRLLTLEEAVAKMTLRPARKLGLADRGQLREGAAADVVVFDAEKIAERASYADPHQFPAGIAYVFVNGALTAAGGALTGKARGRVLSPGRSSARLV